MNESEAKRLGVKDYEFELDKFISANSQELAKVGTVLFSKYFGKKLSCIKMFLKSTVQDKRNIC